MKFHSNYVALLQDYYVFFYNNLNHLANCYWFWEISVYQTVFPFAFILIKKFVFLDWVVYTLLNFDFIKSGILFLVIVWYILFIIYNIYIFLYQTKH
jgi:hypothetical protein